MFLRIYNKQFCLINYKGKESVSMTKTDKLTVYPIYITSVTRWYACINHKQARIAIGKITLIATAVK